MYTTNTAPYFDYDGVEFFISPSAPVNGVAPGVGVQYNATNLFFSTPEPTAVLTEGRYTSLPIVAYQMQSYSIIS